MFFEPLDATFARKAISGTEGLLSSMREDSHHSAFAPETGHRAEPTTGIGGGTGVKRKPLESGFSMIELMLVVTIMGVISAMAIPTAVRQVANYKVHADATSVSSLLNMGRMKAASQFAPFRLDVYVSSGSYVLEQLCGGNTTDTSCTASGATSYTAYSSPSYDTSGTQYLSAGNTFSSCRPSGISAFPGGVSADPTGCPDPARFYFNTRGAPVDSSGNPLTSSGDVIYIQNSKGLVDAVVLSLGGQVSVYNYSSVTSTWSLR
jgi:type IV pilus assembly protein PilA